MKTKEEKRRDCETRLAERKKRSNHEQLQHLDVLLGKGIGAKRERARLMRKS